MIAVRTTLTASQLPETLAPLRSAIEAPVPVGFASTRPASCAARGDRASRPGTGACSSTIRRWPSAASPASRERWRAARHPGRRQPLHRAVPGRGPARVGHAALRLARHRQPHRPVLHRARAQGDAARQRRTCPTATWPGSSPAPRTSTTTSTPSAWAQDYARRQPPPDDGAGASRRCARGCRRSRSTRRPSTATTTTSRASIISAPTCFVTRKGAIRAGAGELGIIPGSMGARSYIVRGLGNPESFCSCAHGAGRRMSRTEARRQFTARAISSPRPRGVECRKDAGVVDEIPGGLQGHRRGDGQPVRPGRGRAHAAAGGVRQGLSSASPPWERLQSRPGLSRAERAPTRPAL